MKSIARIYIIASVSIAFSLGGCALMEPSKPTVFPKSVPDILVSIDCGKCEVRPAVPESIRKGYLAAASKDGVKIETNEQVNLLIKDYRERGLAMRSATLVISVFLPPVAMVLKDEIKADALIDGKHVPVEYNYRMPFFGIESVAQKVGELSFYAAVKQITPQKSTGQ